MKFNIMLYFKSRYFKDNGSYNESGSSLNNIPNENREQLSFINSNTSRYVQDMQEIKKKWE